jgi:DNA-binding NarL/FixJ family response regulator
MPRPTVLLADDHPGILAALSELLGPKYEIVGIASDGAAAVSSARWLNPDIVLMDISMPCLDGVHAARLLREKGVRSRIVFVTAHHDPEILAEALQSGASGYVIKSRMRSDLIPAIERALGGQIFISQ